MSKYDETVKEYIVVAGNKSIANEKLLLHAALSATTTTTTTTTTTLR